MKLLNVGLHIFFNPEMIPSLLWMFSVYVDMKLLFKKFKMKKMVTMIFSTVALQNVSLIKSIKPI